MSAQSDNSLDSYNISFRQTAVKLFPRSNLYTMADYSEMNVRMYDILNEVKLKL